MGLYTVAFCALAASSVTFPVSSTSARQLGQVTFSRMNVRPVTSRSLVVRVLSYAMQEGPEVAPCAWWITVSSIRW
jgi:hypothetical protein